MSHTITGTNSNDILFLEGETTPIQTTITNSYSGEVVAIDDEYYQNTATYYGGGGIDSLFMTNQNDALFITDSNGTQMIFDVERFIAGDGHDLIKLDHETITLGNILVDGGLGNDIVWSNAGNDLIYGKEGDDILDGGLGNDTVEGGLGNDTVRGGMGNDIVDGGLGNDLVDGGLGNDRLYGGDGNDILVGGPSSGEGLFSEESTPQSHEFSTSITFPDLAEGVAVSGSLGSLKEFHGLFNALYNVSKSSGQGKAYEKLVANIEKRFGSIEDSSYTDMLGIAEGDLTVDYQTTATVSLAGAATDTANALGFYNIGTDGTIHAAEMVFANVQDQLAGDSATINLPGTNGNGYGFFMIANQDSQSDFDGLDLSSGTLNFFYHYGQTDERLANINDAAADLSLVFSDGVTDTVIGDNDHILHTTERGGSTALNGDGKAHVISGVVEGSEAETLRIGFEDSLNMGDYDHNDLLFDLTVASQGGEGTLLVDDADYLDGGLGDDNLDGGVGDDILIGGEGADILYGGHGSDQFVFTAMDGMVDTVQDFELGAGGDILNVTDILQGYDALSDLISDFVQLTDNSNGDTELKVNATGENTGTFETVAVIEGGLGGSTVDDLFAAGNLLANQSALI